MVVDSSALVAILLDELEASLFALTIASVESAVVSAASYLEFGMVALSRAGLRTEEVDQAVTSLGIEVVAVSSGQARQALAAFARFGKGQHPARLNFGDCFSYALAKSRGEPLLFKGDDFPKTDVLPAVLG